MPLGEIVGEALGGIARIAGRFFVEIIFEVLIKGSGYLVIRIFRPKAEPSESTCAMVGLAVWACAIVFGVWLYRQVAGLG